MLGDVLTSSDARAAVLAGPAGVGKTRLGHECLRVAERSGLETVRVTATRSAAQLPFGALVPVLDAASPNAGEADDVDGQLDLLRRSLAALGDGSDGRRLVLFVDDAHLLDDASATLVHQVAATGSAIVLATVRTGEPAPDPVVALWKDGLAERVEVTGLSAEATTEFLATVLEGPVDPATAVRFTERCQGNALFLRELVVGALDDGSLQSDGGMWRLAGQLSPSPRLVEIVEAQLGQLDDGERALMELVAHGEPLGLAELALLSDPAIAEGLERRDLLASRLDRRRLQVHLAHPIHGDVVRARTPALRVRAIAQSLAEAVEARRGQRHDDMLRVATWRVLAGGGDPDTLMEGATMARWRHDFPLAERLARAAVDAGAGFASALLAAQVTGLQGRREEAEGELAALAAEAANDTQRGSVAAARFDNHRAWTGGHAPWLLDEAARTITDHTWRDRLRARRLAVVLAEQGPQVAAHAAQSLAARADGEALVLACLVGAYSLARIGRLDAAIEMSERGREAQQVLDTPLARYPWWQTVTSCVALRHAGRFAEVDRVVAAHHGDALAEGSIEAQAVFALLEADGVDDRGRARSAACRVREVLATGQDLGCLVLTRHGHRAGAVALALNGEADEAAQQLRALHGQGRPPGLLDEVDLLRARGWVAAAAGDLRRARRGPSGGTPRSCPHRTGPAGLQPLARGRGPDRRRPRAGPRRPHTRAGDRRCHRARPDVARLRGHGRGPPRGRSRGGRRGRAPPSRRAAGGGCCETSGGHTCRAVRGPGDPRSPGRRRTGPAHARRARDRLTCRGGPYEQGDRPAACPVIAYGREPPPACVREVGHLGTRGAHRRAGSGRLSPAGAPQREGVRGSGQYAL